MKLIYFALVSLVICKEEVGTIHRIKLTENGPVQTMPEDQVFKLIGESKHFFDLTGQTDLRPSLSLIATPLPKKLAHGDVVKIAQQKVDTKEITTFLTKYSSFPNRYYANENGVKAAAYLFDQVKLAGTGFKGNFTVNYFNHSWLQPSIIARLEGKEAPNEIVIIGAHLDSINQSNPKNGLAPGADDDGSGTTSVLETLRSLAKSGFTPRRSIEFQFYAAEEVGLRGSQAIANSYANSRKNVVGMLQLDMTGYNVNKQIKLLTDYTDPELTQFVRTLIENYSTFKWINGKCGYACSDHASYNKVGYRSAQPGEDILNERLHTIGDTIKFIDMDNIAEFAKLGISFAVELGIPA